MGKEKRIMQQYDERDMMFARMARKEGTWQYEDYYQRHPEKKAIDDELRTLPEMGQAGSVMYDEINSKMADAAFLYLSDINSLCEGIKSKDRVVVDAEAMTKKIKGFATFYHADLVGITRTKKEHYYAVRGRHDQNYGDPVTEHLPYGIVFAVHMDKDMLMTAPMLPEMLATTRGYVEAATIGMVLSYFIRSLGYEARNHMDANYLTIVPKMAVDAGLGEFGRNGMLITKEYGACVRLGVVTTDLPLVCDDKKAFGVEEFCTQCGRCSLTCPGKAICKGEKYDQEGKLQWKINSEQCYKRFRSLGTDCGICIVNCPFTYQMSIDEITHLKNPEVRTKILREFQEKYKLRPMKRTPEEWLR